MFIFLIAPLVVTFVPFWLWPLKIAIAYKSNGAGNHIIVPTNEKEERMM
jgi:hypothetical protein